jgi:hypothetical protein
MLPAQAKDEWLPAPQQQDDDDDDDDQENDPSAYVHLVPPPHEGLEGLPVLPS